MNRKEFEQYIVDAYSENGDCPFENDTDTTVFRHSSNRKWFCIVMSVSKRKLGIPSDEIISIVNVKCPQEIIDSFWQENGVYPAYHMNKAHWLSVALDGSADDETVKFLLSLSYDLTLTKITKRKRNCGNGEN